MVTGYRFPVRVKGYRLQVTDFYKGSFFVNSDNRQSRVLDYRLQVTDLFVSVSGITGYYFVKEMMSVTRETVVVTDERAVDQIPVAMVAEATRSADAGT